MSRKTIVSEIKENLLEFMSSHDRGMYIKYYYNNRKFIERVRNEDKYEIYEKIVIIANKNNKWNLSYNFLAKMNRIVLRNPKYKINTIHLIADTYEQYGKISYSYAILRKLIKLRNIRDNEMKNRIFNSYIRVLFIRGEKITQEFIEDKIALIDDIKNLQKISHNFGIYLARKGEVYLAKTYLVQSISLREGNTAGYSAMALYSFSSTLEEKLMYLSIALYNFNLKMNKQYSEKVMRILKRLKGISDI